MISFNCLLSLPVVPDVWFSDRFKSLSGKIPLVAPAPDDKTASIITPIKAK